MKRVFAWIGIIVLVSLYIVTLISACMSSEKTNNFFWASAISTVIVPLMLYIILRLHDRVVKHRKEIVEYAEDEIDKASKESDEKDI